MSAIREKANRSLSGYSVEKLENEEDIIIFEKGFNSDSCELTFDSQNYKLNNSSEKIQEKATLAEILRLIKYDVVKKSDMVSAKIEIIKGQEEGFGNISKLIKENDELRRVLNKKYSAATLFIGSSMISVFLIITIISFFALHFSLIHPVLSIPLLIGSVIFSILSFWKM